MEKLSREKGRTEEYELYSLVERLGPEIIAGERKMYKGVSANVDFYSGFVYHMLDLPLELYTPLFAMARVAGWSAHSSTWAKSSARPTSMWGTTRIMRRLRSGDLKSIRKKCVRR